MICQFDCIYIPFCRLWSNRIRPDCICMHPCDSCHVKNTCRSRSYNLWPENWKDKQWYNHMQASCEENLPNWEFSVCAYYTYCTSKRLKIVPAVHNLTITKCTRARVLAHTSFLFYLMFQKSTVFNIHVILLLLL